MSVTVGSGTARVQLAAPETKKEMVGNAITLAAQRHRARSDPSIAG